MEYIYLLTTREFIKSNESIHKIGRTSQENLKRYMQYSKGSRLLFHINCIDSKAVEKKIINIFKIIFIQRKDIGNEYFEGCPDKMIDYLIFIRQRHCLREPVKYELIIENLLDTQDIEYIKRKEINEGEIKNIERENKIKQKEIEKENKIKQKEIEKENKIKQKEIERTKKEELKKINNNIDFIYLKEWIFHEFNNNTLRNNFISILYKQYIDFIKINHPEYLITITKFGLILNNHSDIGCNIGFKKKISNGNIEMQWNLNEIKLLSIF